MTNSIDLDKTLEALNSAQGILNPVSGFLLKRTSKRASHVEKVRAELRVAIAEVETELRRRRVGRPNWQPNTRTKVDDAQR